MLDTRKLLKSPIIRRFASFYIDLIMISVITLLYLFFLNKGPFVQNKGFPYWDISKIWIFQLVIYTLYFLFCEYYFGTTLGKRLLGFRLEGKRNFMNIFIRTIVRLIPFEPLSFVFSSKDLFWHESWSKCHTIWGNVPNSDNA